MMEGKITDIQRFCLTDGPGIRTSVFFKGCNMRCTWCHNPETISKQSDIHFYDRNCIGCLKCVEVCPTGAQRRIGELHYFDRSLCNRCGRCAEICYAGAMAVSDRAMRVEDVMFEILQDKPYYLGSGGGVTLTGGEVFCQPEFALAIAKACKDENIPVAAETNLSFPFETMEPVLPYLDLIMLDIKLYDNEEHKKWTGVGNETVFSNLKNLGEYGMQMIVRTPLIPNATDSEQNLCQIAEILSGQNGLLFYELLNFNPLGEAKYKSLQMTNYFEKARPLSEKKLQELVGLLEKYDLTIRVS